MAGGESMSQYNHPDDNRSSKDYVPGPYGGKEKDKLSNKQGKAIFDPKQPSQGNHKV